MLVAFCASSLALTTPRPARAQTGAGVSPELRAALERVSADSLRGHLSFIASDALEGRRTPSRGLDLAAEYIAAQFRRAGLEPAGGDGYFQTAEWTLRGRDLAGFSLTLHAPSGDRAVGAGEVSLTFDVQGRSLFSVGETPIALERAPVFKVDFADAPALAALKPEQLKGRVVVTEIPDFRREDRATWREAFQRRQEFLGRLGALGAAAVISFDRQSARGTGAGTPRLIDPEARPARAQTQAGAATAGGASTGGTTTGGTTAGGATAANAPTGATPSGASPQAAATPQGGAATMPPVRFVTAHGPAATAFYDSLKPGGTDASVTLLSQAPTERPVKVRNVVGLLRGSDPTLRDTYVMLSAHYDHVGVREGGEDGDRVFNGANDNGSGTVSVIEIANALASLKTRPKRSVLFVAFFGEELGLVGSRYYGRHPVVPIEKTVAQVNLEQVGRTDDSEGPQILAAAVTGFDFSDVGELLRGAGERAGVRFYKHPQKSDAFFGRSDNQSLADQGVPAHTVGVAFEFPDYHAVGDHWEKIDYANMERVVRAVMLGLHALADSAREPRWSETNPKAARYLQAWRERRAAK